MEGIGFLTVLSGSMFLGSYVAGSIPIMFSMSESRMRMVSIFGAGLLLGTALSVIIPEGVESLYNGLLGEFLSIKTRRKRGITNIPEFTNLDNVRKRRGSPTLGPPAVITKEIENTGHPPHRTRGVHREIGYPLVFGFIFMLLVDQISSAAGSKSDRSGRNRMGISATIGLVVHAAADGIALGSASTTNKSDIQLIVFVAIMLHKGPAAFGLVSFLLLEGIDVRNARKHLIVFACAAPFATILTFVVLGALGNDSVASSGSSTGILMLFSAGTFLFVATVHVLPELVRFFC
ncbi:metal cation transporter, ZIP family [Dictyocaulus viviparus]|uniref:Metal cation transporter, ZIP family n=1 Tax=Dictyocaulus viviparus TaxID=29172 RepID=A0A0D8Y645_DICVI|nr:metal cation transporter, ZIP family [Dictyocaulus viviparus]